MSEELRISNGINMLSMSMSTGATVSMDLLPTAERDLVTTLCVTTIGVRTMAVDAETSTTSATDTTTVTESAPSMDNPTTDNPYSHIQCLLDGLADDLTEEQRIRAIAFIRSRSNIFSRSEYDIGRMRIILHRIDTRDNSPHFEQL